MAYFLALDAGGTKTDYVLADEHEILARVRTGTIKRLRADAETATRHLEEGLTRLSLESGISMQHVQSTCVGTAGETVALVTDWLRAEIQSRVRGDLLLLGDVEIALDAAFPGQAGILVLAGTGSNVAGRTHRGPIVTVGGWGPVLADQGSGHRIGHQALRAVALARDQSRPTALFEEVLAFWQLTSFDQLVEHANRSPLPDFSRLASVVVHTAERGDSLAQEILRQQGQELGEMVRALIPRLQATQDANFTPQLAFAGSIMENVSSVRNALVHTVQAEFPSAEVLAGVVDPVHGALWRARTIHPSTTKSQI